MELSFEIKSFQELSNLELYRILQARQDIFILEQQCIYPDLDDIDLEATHLFYKRGENIAAYCRLYWDKERASAVKIGRVIAVERSTGLGGALMEQAVRVANSQYQPQELILHAQVYAIGFYEKSGFRQISPHFMEDDIPHCLMQQDCHS